MKLYYHPLSSNCQKVLMALYEKDAAFEPAFVDMFDIEANRRYRENINPIGKIPSLLTDEGELIPESSIIVEYVDRASDGALALIPDSPDEARRTRQWDRFIDFYVNEPLSKAHQDRLRPSGRGDPFGAEQARKRLKRSYRILDERLAQTEWLNGSCFSLADCAAAPSLHVGQFAQGFDEFEHVKAYYHRLVARPTWRRIWSEAEQLRPRINADIDVMRVGQGWSARQLAEA
jgi:glutathione S-transferase